MVMPINKLFENSDNYAITSESFQNYQRRKINNADDKASEGKS